MDDDAPYHAQIRARFRQRFKAVYVCAFAMLLASVGLYCTLPMTHRSDRVLGLLAGVALAIFALMAVVFAWIVLRQRNFRRRMLREGRREPGQMHAIAQTSVNLPVGPAAGQPVGLWRLEARYFEPVAGTYVVCHSDWMGAPVPVLTADTPLPPILVDPRNPLRYWLPVGTLFDHG